MLEEHVEEKKGFIMDLSLILKDCIPEDNIKSDGKVLAIKIDVPGQISTNEEYNKFIDSIKKCISAVAKKESVYENSPFDKCIIYLDFTPTKQFLFAYAKELMRYRVNLAKGHGFYHNIDIEIGDYGKWKHKLHKAEKKIISREINEGKENSGEDLEKNIKHIIEGPDLRPWPLREFNLVAEEVLSIDKTTHRIIRYIRPKHIIFKPTEINEPHAI